MNQTSNNSNYPESLSRFDARRQRHEQRTDYSNRGSGVVMGLVLIVLGVGFYFHTMGLFTFPFHNWWALFILIPAIGLFTETAQRFQQANFSLTPQALRALTGGVVLTLVASIFLFELSWTIAGPAMMVLGGLGVLASSFMPSK